MRFLEATLPTLAENLALDEALLLEAEAGRSAEILRLWEFPSIGVVLGAGCKLTEDVDEDACRTDAVPIQRRSSGGGTVLLGNGCLCYSLVLQYRRAPELREIASSYAYISKEMCAALADVDPAIAPAGTSDLAAAGLKVSGNSQQRKRDFLLHHGTLLYDFDFSHVERYLRMPRRQPDYRRGRTHGAFLRNMPTWGAELKNRLRRAWDAVEATDEWPVALVQQLVLEKYGTEEWTRRR
ncbi:MAG: lipoate--protein ligase family protein [Gemmataceae bacterium]|nr:lipoate--protein ligase family protein [Gemmataceae bacterium]